MIEKRLSRTAVSHANPNSAADEANNVWEANATSAKSGVAESDARAFETSPSWMSSLEKVAAELPELATLPRESGIDDPEISRTVALLGGSGMLHRPVHNRLEAHDLLQKGLPGPTLEHLVRSVAFLRAPDHDSLEKAVGISYRTYQRRRDAGDKPLSPEQSGRTWKFAEILGRATALFGSQTEAEKWMERPAMALDRRRPIDLLSTPAGVEFVEEHMTRLEYGVYT